jgi:hypothetical protein
MKKCLFIIFPKVKLYYLFEFLEITEFIANKYDASKALNFEPVMHQNSPTSICDSKIIPGVYPQTPIAREGFGTHPPLGLWLCAPAPRGHKLRPQDF